MPRNLEHVRLEKMLLLVPERKQYVCGYKITCLHGKNVEVIGQTMVFCFQKWEGSETGRFQESCRSEDRGFRGPNFLQPMTDLAAYVQQTSWGGSSAFLFFVVSSRWSKLCFSLFWTWYCRGIFGPANFSLKQFSDYECAMIAVVTSVIHLH